MAEPRRLRRNPILAALSFAFTLALGASAPAATAAVTLPGSYTPGPTFDLVSNASSNAVDTASDQAGNSTVLWTLGRQLYAQKYDAGGAAAGPALFIADAVTVVEGTTGAAIAMQSNGDFAVAWQTCNGATSNVCDISARRFQADGTAKGPATVVNTTSARTNYFVQIAGNDSGELVVVWQRDSDFAPCCQLLFAGDSIHARRYSGATPLGDEFAVTQESSNLGRRSVGMAADGRFVIAFGLSSPLLPSATPPAPNGPQQRQSDRLVFQRFNADGSTAGRRGTVSQELLSGGRLLDGSIEDLPPLYQFGPSYFYDVIVEPSVAVRPDGSFAVAWSEEVDVQLIAFLGRGVGQATTRLFFQSYSQNGLLTGARGFAASGQLLRDGSSYGPSGAVPGYPMLASEPAGNYVLAWVEDGRYSTGEVNVSGVYAQRLSPTGLPLGLPLRARFDEAADHSAYEQGAVSVSGRGDITLAWSARFERFVQVRRYTAP